MLCIWTQNAIPSPGQAPDFTASASMEYASVGTDNPCLFLTNCTENKSLLVDFAEILHGRKDDVIT